ncbi:lysine/ornithine decarboxylase [mine drainage metagenome]|uniref:ornithine decarboxylase n=1 Tax=mine drainage metagenome TaxID=410659 RepID=A0A1J5S026_9ZZZZ
MTDKISRFLASAQPETPCLVVDLDVIAGNYHALRHYLPLAEVFYAVKANPAPEVIALLAGLGSSFDTASRPEIEAVLAAGVAPGRISFGNTIKKLKDIAWAYERGVRLFAFDSEAELDKLAEAAPGSKVFCRLLMTCEGAEWPLSRKFGCEADMARALMLKARALGLVPYGLSFHVGSQQTRLDQWDLAIGRAAALFRDLAAEGIALAMLNLGGGLPARYRDDVAPVERYAGAIMQAMTDHFGNDLPQMITEPGRSLVGDSGILETEVVLVSRKSFADDERWVYLDVGKFGGLAETMDEAIKYRLQLVGGGEGPSGPVVLAGPTCDSADILYEKHQYQMPLSLKPGDRVRILSTGAYTTSYAAVNFNGFAPLKAYFV